MKKVAVDHLKLAHKFPTRYYFIWESVTYSFDVKDPEFLTVYVHENLQQAINMGAHEICVVDYARAFFARGHGWTGRLMLDADLEDPVLVASHEAEFTGVCLTSWDRRTIAEYAQLGLDVHIDGVVTVREVLDLAQLPIRSISTIFPLKAAAQGVILHPDPEVAMGQDWSEMINPVEWCEYFPGIARKNLDTVKAWLNGKQGEVPVWL